MLEADKWVVGSIKMKFVDQQNIVSARRVFQE